mmetsp:Transcript_34049/g.67806  ORF Transcript_34049/g.67806 Transcript_34049/m.67806 type:complete len:86 (-) Transcript_34049:1251-1508(-)
MTARAPSPSDRPPAVSQLSRRTHALTLSRPALTNSLKLALFAALCLSSSIVFNQLRPAPSFKASACPMSTFSTVRMKRGTACPPL